MGDLKRKIIKLKNMPLDQVIKKVISKSYDFSYYKARKQLIKYRPIEIDDLYFKRFNPSLKFFYDLNEKEEIVRELLTLNVKESIIKDADKICSHTFNLLGSGEVKFGENIYWNKDYKSGYTWEDNFYKDIKIVDLNNNSDVKFPWELSRFQHLFTLGKAYWLTDDEKYAKEFQHEIEDWIMKNPIEMSVNWTCTMDVGIRAANWIAAYFFFKDSELLDDLFWQKFNNVLYLHGRFIYKNLENNGPYTGNHYLSNLVGLVWLGLYFGSFNVRNLGKENVPANWLSYGLAEMEKEMFVQNNPDGTNYEASTSYHRLVTELFIITTKLCEKNKIVFSKEYMQRLELMCDFLMNITKPNGLSPLIGDADDGRFLILSSYYDWVKNDFRHLLGIAGEMFNRDDFSVFGQAYKEDTLWMYPKPINKSYKPVKLGSKAYKDGGYYILRTDMIYCLIRCGELSFRGDGVHSHNDQLSFELNVNGEDYILDPGSYLYTSDYKMRNHFRSTRMHNTIVVNNLEQNEFEEKNIFYMKEQTNSKCLIFQEEKFKGTHYGYVDKCNIVHEREILINDTEIIITDSLKGNHNTNGTFVLHLAPDIQHEISDNKILLIKNKKHLKINTDQEFLIENSEISNGYGSILDSTKISFQTKKIVKLS